VVVTFRDVTSQVRLQEELRRSHEQLRVALSAAHAISWCWDIRDDRYAYSEDFGAFYGVPTGEHHGADLAAEAVHPDDRAMVQGEAARCLETNQDFRVEFRGPEKGRETRWYASHGQAFRDAAGQPVQMVGVTWDITARKKLEQERATFELRVQESQKLERLGVLAGGIAHDFNNILTAILGNADLAEGSLARDDSARPFLADIGVGARRAAELCRQMLAYAGKGRFVLGLCDLNQLVEETARLLHVSISKTTVLRFHPHAHLPLVLGDPTQLRQVIMNFVTNASDAIGERTGAITIGTGVVSADRPYLDEIILGQNIPPGEYVYLDVGDDGQGMSAETLERIFEPFFTTKFTGRGLGLAAVLGIVRTHRGALNVRSEPGKGSTFRLLLPVSREPGQPALKVRAGTSLVARGAILVVDDEETVRAVAGAMLAKVGFKVLTASDARQAVDLFSSRRKEIVAVLMDLTMPRLDGEDLFGKLRRTDPDIPVLLMSGYTEHETIARFIGKGLAGFIQKPFGLEDLREQLRALLG
jgi:two-component system, cell cycle sensor histidine kinase and response regulator CckA